MKYIFKNRLSQWWHCLIRWHRPATATFASGWRDYYCYDCLLAHENAVSKLSIHTEEEWPEIVG